MKRILTVLLLLSFSGCASIPLSTMIELSSFDENAFLELEPEDLSVKVHVDKPVELDKDNIEMAVTITTRKGDLKFYFPIGLISQNDIPKDDAWFSSVPERTEYQFELTIEAVDTFRQFQSNMRAEKPESYGLDVRLSMIRPEQEITEVIASVFIKLNRESDYLTLFDRVSLSPKVMRYEKTQMAGACEFSKWDKRCWRGRHE